MKQKKSVDTDVKIAADFMHVAWNAVSQSTIVNCFHKAHFIASHPDQAARDNDDNTGIEEIPLTTLTADKWNRIPGDTVTLTVDEIAASCFRDPDNASDSKHENASTIQPDSTCPLLLSALPQLRQFVCTMAVCQR